MASFDLLIERSVGEAAGPAVPNRIVLSDNYSQPDHVNYRIADETVFELCAIVCGNVRSEIHALVESVRQSPRLGSVGWSVG